MGQGPIDAGDLHRRALRVLAGEKIDYWAPQRELPRDTPFELANWQRVQFTGALVAIDATGYYAPVVKIKSQWHRLYTFGEDWGNRLENAPSAPDSIAMWDAIDALRASEAGR
jgi:hypothetical protein